MRKRSKRKMPINDDYYMGKDRSAIIQDICVYDKSNDLRKVLDQSLRYYNKASDDILEYRERDIKHYMVNHIRHDISSYEYGLRDIHYISKRQDDKTKDLNYHLYKNATLNQIAKVYPMIEDECNQQKVKINMIRKIKNNHPRTNIKEIINANDSTG